jgi:isopenicillin-N epimerase
MALKELFLLDPAVHFLNHGSFGACPIPVFEVYQAWQRRLERQPVLFLGREMPSLDLEARTPLAAYLGTQPANLAFVTNATHAVNIVARSLALTPGDEILASDHEYGACEYAWEFVCRKTGAVYIRRPLAFPLATPDDLLEQFWQGVTSRTKVIYLSHITAPTALRLPVEAVCARARQAGILTLVDGAHAPGQIALDLEAIGADFYTGNLHKWALAPKGVGFLYARPAAQQLIEPLVVSWGYHADPQNGGGSRFNDYLGWTGTKDPAAALAVPAALRFMQEHNWPQVRRDCHLLLRAALEQIGELTGIEPQYDLDSHQYHQMAVAPLPPATDLSSLKTRLYDEYHVEIPLIAWNDRKFVRISIQVYNDPQDVAALCRALRALMPRTVPPGA